MHSIGSVRPVPRTTAMVNHWWNKGVAQSSQPAGPTLVSVSNPEPTPQMKQENPDNQEPEEDVVVIQEEEMVLVRKETAATEVQQEATEVQQEATVQEEATEVQEEATVQQEATEVQEEAPHPKCIEPESTVKEPSLSNPKPKKKNNKKYKK